MAHPNIKYVEVGESIQQAYDTLPGPTVANPNVDINGGAIGIYPGRHDVGSGLQLNRTKPVTIFGVVPRWKMFDTTDRRVVNAGGAYLYSSVGATALIDTRLPNSFANGQGFAFYDLGFDMGTNCDYGIRGDNVSYTTVDRCRFFGNKANRAAIFLCTQDHVVPGTPHGGDASWWRIYNCTNDGGTFFQTVGVGNGSGVVFNDGGVNLKGYQHNNFIIRDTVSFAGTHMKLYGVDRSIFDGNNWEGAFTTGVVQADRCFRNRFVGNQGEGIDGQSGVVWLWLTRCNGNYVNDFGIRNNQLNYTIVRLTNAPLFGGPSINTPGGVAHDSVDNTIVSPTWGADSIAFNPTLTFPGPGVQDDHPTDQNWIWRPGGHHIGAAF